ncbi:MAG: hypothetical protein AB7P12_16630 [Alphaproteobacteria bacterium]
MRKVVIALSTAFVALLAVTGTGLAAGTAQMSEDHRPVCGEPRGSHDCE